MRGIVIGIMIIILVSGCNILLKKLYRIKEPQLETTESIQKYVYKHLKSTIDYPHYRIDSLFLKQNKVAIPLLEVYDQNGFFVIAQNQNCNYNILENAIKSDKRDSSKSFLSVIKNYALLFSNKEYHLDNNKYKFLVYWTKWSGKVSTNLIRELINYEKNHPDKVSIVLVNADFQKNWYWAQKFIEKK